MGRPTPEARDSEPEARGATSPVLHVRVDDEFGEAQDLPAQVEGVPEARLLALLGRERLDRLQVEVVVQVKVVQVLCARERRLQSGRENHGKLVPPEPTAVAVCSHF